jgi:hypothetical protein
LEDFFYVSKSTVMPFVRTARRIQKLRSILEEPIQCVETARYFGVTLDTQFIWAAHISQVGKEAAQRLGVLGPLLNRRRACPSETVCCSTSSSFVQ